VRGLGSITAIDTERFSSSPAGVSYRSSVTTSRAFSREPKQERSRASFERALDTAVALLVERRSAGFTLAEVAERSGVSIGSIYARVDSKDDLLRAAHVREMIRIADQQRGVFEALRPADDGLAGDVRRVIRATADLLRSNAGVMAPFMLLANTDPVVADVGRAAHGELAEAFAGVLLARRAEIRHPDPEHAVAWSFTVVYSVLARWLGLGSDLASAGEGEWEQILADLTAMVTAFLAGREGQSN
jgi:AcrR family transcriptional regulator